jgi:hypothetical protein
MENFSPAKPNDQPTPEVIFETSLEYLGQEDTDTYQDIYQEAGSEDQREEILQEWLAEISEVHAWNKKLEQHEAYVSAAQQTKQEYSRTMAELKLPNEIYEVIMTQNVELDTSKIGWIPGNDKIELEAERCEYQGQIFWVASITDQQKVTNEAYNKLEKQGIADKLMGSIKASAGAVFLQTLTSGSGSLRPMSKGRGSKKRANTIDTEYPSYKIDVQGSNNRAILILPEKIEGQPVLIVAALFDHEDDGKVYNVVNA